MHKSAIITRLNLILIGSITMMMAIPFASMNILSNNEVFGQEYDKQINRLVKETYKSTLQKHFSALF